MQIYWWALAISVLYPGITGTPFQKCGVVREGSEKDVYDLSCDSRKYQALTRPLEGKIAPTGNHRSTLSNPGLSTLSHSAAYTVPSKTTCVVNSDS